jgi:CDK inhibitor PHO81
MLNLHDEGIDAADLGPLPPGAEPPRDGSISMAGGGVRNQDQDKGESFRAHRAVFFFKLGRELEKVCVHSWE